MNDRDYYNATVMTWKFLHQRLDHCSKAPEWWDRTMKEAAEALEPFRGTDAQRYALAQMVTVLGELQDIAYGIIGTPGTISLEYGTIEDAVMAIQAAQDVTKVEYQDRGGRRGVRFQIRKEKQGEG